jgi:hypothetical protein
MLLLSDIAGGQRARSLRFLPRQVIGVAAVVHQREREVLLGSGGGQTLAPPDAAAGHVLALGHGAHGGVGFNDEADALGRDGAAGQRNALDALALSGPGNDGSGHGGRAAAVDEGVGRFEARNALAERGNALGLGAARHVGGGHVLDPHARVRAAANPAVLQGAHRGVGHGGAFDHGGVVDADGGAGVGGEGGIVLAEVGAVAAGQGAAKRGAGGTRQQPKPGGVAQGAVQRKAECAVERRVGKRRRRAYFCVAKAVGLAFERDDGHFLK